MSFENLLKNQQNTADNLVGNVAVSPILKRGFENVKLIVGPQIIYESTTVGQGMWGVGFGNGVDDDGVWGEEGYYWQPNPYDTDLVFQRVVNYNNKYIEWFTTEHLKHADTTANWDTSGLLAMSDLTSHSTVNNTVAISENIFRNNQTVYGATLECEEHIWGNDIIKYYLSADGGTNWEEVTRNVEHNFTNTGQLLRFKIVFIGNGNIDTYIKKLNITYRT